MKTITRSNKPRRLGEILIDEGVITKDELNIALTEQKKVDMPLDKLLVNLGFATEAIMRSALAEVLTEEAWLEGVSGVYAAHLTAAELADTRAFYASDAGQRILHVAPMIDNDVEAALGSLFDAHEDQLAELIDGALAERFPELAEEDSDG